MIHLEFKEYRPRKIVNIHKHVDAWFWDKYSAHPYIGCSFGCEFCYSRGSHYLGRRSPETFDRVIQVKMNAVELLRKELPRLKPDVIACGDWQMPAENRYQLSRGMLEVVHDMGFPAVIIERSPSVCRDLDLLSAINAKTWAGVIFSISTLDLKLKRAFEPRSPGVGARLKAMTTLAKSGLLVGAAFMPIIPFLGDDEKHLEETIRAVADCGGRFVLAGGLTMDGVQADRTLGVVKRLAPHLESRWRDLYRWKADGQPAYSPPKAYSAALGLAVRQLCTRHGLKDRMPRYCGSGPLAVNKQIAERLFLTTYDLELHQANDYRVWAYRKAAWTVDELEHSIVDLYQGQGEAGLRNLPGVGRALAEEIGRLVREVGQTPSGGEIPDLPVTG